MKSLVTNSQHRANARRALDGQWGIMAWLTFLGVVLQSFLTSIVQNLFSGENQVFQSSFAAVLLQIFVLFALSYALYYAALKVLRGEKVRQYFNECFSRKILWSAICGQPTSKST